MGEHGDPWLGKAGIRRAWGVAIAAALLLAVTACTEDSDSGDGDGGSDAGGEDAGGGAAPATDLLGPEDPAAGEPVRIGLVSDGQSQAFDATSEIRAAQATAGYWNQHKGGIGGRPIEIVVCETGADPAVATDCGNQMVEDGVVAVTVGMSTVPDSIWDPLHQAGIPMMFFQTTGDPILGDAEWSFVLSNPLTTAFGLPISVAEDEGADTTAFVVIDVPVALALFADLGRGIVENAGFGYELVRVPPGTADLTSQMRDVVDSGAGVVQVVGNDALCIAAYQGLMAAGYQGRITTVSQCITDATRDAMASRLQGIFITSGVAIGATDDPTHQLYEAVMDAFGDNVEISNAVSMVGYSVIGSLATALEGIAGEITPATVARTIKAMPDKEIPGGGGVHFRCGGSATATYPAVCSNQWLRAELDAEGRSTAYEAVDSAGILEGL